MVATNFSAFTVFGTSGAGYRDGYAFFPIMGFGTGFMALTFWIIGRKVCELGHLHGLITPPELIRKIYQSPGLSVLFSVVMIVFTIPYLALQPMAAGYALEELIGLPYVYGCILVTGIILLYTLRGGLRAVAWTDLFQGLLMFILLGVALIMVVWHHGGLVAANQKALSAFPELFTRPGGLGKYSVGIWLSFMVLWFFCDPMFPQLFQRFFSAKNDRVIARTMLFYPLVCTVVFFMPITVGVLGRLSFPGLVGKEADRILPMVLTAISGDFMAALVLAAGLAALMSTMDSQLLTLSSIFSRDIAPLVKKNRKENSMMGRIFVITVVDPQLHLFPRHCAPGQKKPERKQHDGSYFCDLPKPGRPGAGLQATGNHFADCHPNLYRSGCLISNRYLRAIFETGFPGQRHRFYSGR
jgi:SSS family solute:Na+ symporter